MPRSATSALGFQPATRSARKREVRSRALRGQGALQSLEVVGGLPGQRAIARNGLALGHPPWGMAVQPS